MDVARVLDLVRPFFVSREVRGVLREAPSPMSVGLFDLGLGEEDELAMRQARLRPFVIDREAALRLMTDAGERVAAAVRRRPLLSGAPFRLPGYEDAPD